MDKLLKYLEVHRNSFERLYEETTRYLSISSTDAADILGNLQLLEQKIDVISDYDRQLLDKMIEMDADEEEIENQVLKADALRGKYNRLRARIEKYYNKDESFSDVDSKQSSSKNKFTLPKLELKKFGGDIKDWLHFWSQFKRIHEDDSINIDDKFQYLFQATIPKSRARRLIESYPPIEANYEKVIASFKSRFGRDDLLIEMYVRELLKLVLSNVNSKFKLCDLYDQIESQLRSLESLGVTSDQCAAMLFPLVESCLTEDLLRVWQRSRDLDSESSMKSRLNDLMKFLKREVENDEKISLATSRFGLQHQKKSVTHGDNSLVPTTSGLINSKKPSKCVFCSKNHFSQECDDENFQKLSISDKKSILLKKGYCYRCLKFGHLAKRCNVKMFCNFCKGRHATIMCQENVQNISDGKVNEVSKVVEGLSNSTSRDETFLQTLSVLLVNGRKIKRVRLLIDTGSQKSYIAKQTVVEMGYEPVGTEKIIHALFGGFHSNEISHSVYRITVRNMNQSYECNFTALDQTLICGQVLSVVQGVWKNECSNLNIELSDNKEGPIEVLIGSDIAGKLYTGRRHVLNCGLVVMETSLGWTLMGKVCSSIMGTSSLASLSVTSLLNNEDISHLWKLDLIGITDAHQQRKKEDIESKVMEHFLETVTIGSDQRYIVCLPWIEDQISLENNFDLAKKRLDNLMKKLENDGRYGDYNDVLCDWLREGIIEELPSDVDKYDGYYLPHRHVIKESSQTTKLRPVFDASAHTKGRPSLNQCLETGINLIELIPAVLLRFRLGRIGVVSDIKRAFLQIGIQHDDRNFLKFLWYDENDNLKIFRHTRVVFGLTSSPFHLAAVINYHLQRYLTTHDSKYCSQNIEKLRDSFYVDNCITSHEDETELKEFISQSIAVMLEGNFELRGWEHSFLPSDTEEEIKMTQVLGLIWDRKNDHLQLNMNGFKEFRYDKLTKRIILSFTQKLFDPIGFSSPVQIIPKILLQKTWQMKISWDSEVPENISTPFLKWIRELQILSTLKIPRWIFQNDCKNWSVHMFCDASKDAYAAVVFVRCEYSNGTQIQLIASKSRITPLKKISIPRLELLAALIGSRLLHSIQQWINISQIPVYCWTDSTTVLSWILRENSWKQFVNNRIKEIHFLTDKTSWNHVPGSMNPADLASRGCSATMLLKLKWWQGPDWLKKSENWPSQQYQVCEDEVMEERCRELSHTCLETNNTFSKIYSYFSSYWKIVNMMGWMKRFINNSRFPEEKKTGQLTVFELNESEIFLMNIVQKESFNQSEHKNILPLCPFKDQENIIRIKTKITERNDEDAFLYPILLPNRHPLVEKMIFSYHIKNYHVGIQGLLRILREKFWIISGRKAVRRVIRKCVKCQKFNAKKIFVEPVALPFERVRDATVFEIVGIDLTGPLYLRDKGKIWITLFTCAVYRAIHLEIVNSLSTEAFLLCLRRFIARRGRPSTIYTDNGTNFVGADNLLNEIEWNKIVEESNVSRIEWRFNPPGASWWGGWWERLIRILKDLLRKHLGKASLTYDQISTVLCDCEAIINSRPLTYMSEDTEDLLVITPSMFLQENKGIGVPDLDHIDSSNVKRHLKYIQNIKQSLRKRFRDEYLSQLVFQKKRTFFADVKKGDVVLIEDDRKKRMDWPMGVVEETIPGKDQKIRLVKLKTRNGIILRPIQKLYPLELESNDLKNDEYIKQKLQSPNNKISQRIVSSDLESKYQPEKSITSHSNDVPRIEENIELPKISEQSSSVTTRYGRVVKPPKKYK